MKEVGPAGTLSFYGGWRVAGRGESVDAQASDASERRRRGVGGAHGCASPQRPQKHTGLTSSDGLLPGRPGRPLTRTDTHWAVAGGIRTQPSAVALRSAGASTAP